MRVEVDIPASSLAVMAGIAAVLICAAHLFGFVSLPVNAAAVRAAETVRIYHETLYGEKQSEDQVGFTLGENMQETETVTTKSGKTFKVKPWTGRRTDSYGNNPACSCPDLKRVLDSFCVCIGRCYCEKHGGPRCVGGHD